VSSRDKVLSETSFVCNVNVTLLLISCHDSRYIIQLTNVVEEKEVLKKLIVVLSLAVMFGSVSPIMGEAATYHTKAISNAKSNLGVKYLWGGTTPKGFDCSGLVRYSFGKAGKSLPRTSQEMYAKGVRVTKLAPGDLLFFGPTKASKPTHVAIYMGNGQMIHSASSKGVSITTTSNSYWKPKYLGAKRF